MTIGEIVDGLDILELKGLIYKNEDFIELRDYRYIQMLYFHRKKIEKNIFGWKINYWLFYLKKLLEIFKKILNKKRQNDRIFL